MNSHEPVSISARSGVVSSSRGDAFWKTDWLAAAIVTVVSFGVYLYTLMPNVGLQDSGELVTAASLFGVPHPPSYPLWSLCGFILTQLVPIGNYAWRINLLSAVFGSATCAVLTLLVASSSRWLLRRSLPTRKEDQSMISFFGATAAGLILAFSDAVWGQGVFAEVYTLNAFLLLLTLMCLYRWIVAPEKQRWLVGAVFFFVLGLTNHPTMLMILPAFLLPVFLVRRRFFPSFLGGFILLIVTAMAVLTWCSEDSGMQFIARRLALAQALVVGGIAFWHLRSLRLSAFFGGALTVALFWLAAGQWMGGWFETRTVGGVCLLLLTALAAGLVVSSRLDWKFILAMVLAGWCGLLVFAKTPVASATNPPMNWSYARDSRGLYQSIIRGQYANSLSSKIKDFVGPLVGYHEPKAQTEKPDIQASIQFSGIVMMSIKLYGRSLEDNFTLPVCLLAFPLFLYFGHLDRRQRPWVYFMILSFLLLAFTLTFVDTPQQLDRASWQAVKPFHVLSHCMFVLAIGYGIVSGLLYLNERVTPFPRWIMAGVLFAALLPLKANIAECSQRNHWFGWQYGVDMLRPMEKNAILFGGTDPGRFVPTYMIFCESQQPARLKRDPSFDRRDLYIITQNALADHAYIQYIRDQYDNRYQPKKFSRFEKWLGRDKQYPAGSLHLPDDKEYNDCFEEFYRQRQTGVAMDVGDIFLLNSILAKRIFEENKKDHVFYVEESLPIFWMYPYMVPAGLVMRLNPEPLDHLPPEVIAADRKFWDEYTARLMADPNLRDDVDAERSFSKLRASIGNMYHSRGLNEEALYAYRQALALSPDNGEVINYCFQTLLEMGRYEEALQTARDASQDDPRNDSYRKMMTAVQERRELADGLREIRAALEKSPQDYDLNSREVEILIRMRDFKSVKTAMERVVTLPQLPQEQFVEYVKYVSAQGDYDFALRLMEIRLKVDSKNGDLIYNYAAFLAYRHHSAEALHWLEAAMGLNRDVFRQSAQTDERFRALRTNAAFMRLIGPAVKK